MFSCHFEKMQKFQFSKLVFFLGGLYKIPLGTGSPNYWGAAFAIQEINPLKEMFSTHDMNSKK